MRSRLVELCYGASFRTLVRASAETHLFSRSLTKLRWNDDSFRTWWPQVTCDKAYWACITSDEPAVVGISQVSMGLLLLLRGVVRRGALLLQLAKPYLDEGSIDVLRTVFDEINSDNGRLAEQLQPGLDAHDRGNYSQALAIYDDVLTRWPCHPWPWYEKALTSAHAANAPLSDQAALRYALELDPFYVEALVDTEPQRAQRVITDIDPVVRSGDFTAASLGRFGATAMRSDHWTAAHTRVLMGHAGVPYEPFLLTVSLTELGVYDHAPEEPIAPVVQRPPTDPAIEVVTVAESAIDGLLSTSKFTQATQAAEELVATVKQLAQNGVAQLDTVLRAYLVRGTTRHRVGDFRGAAEDGRVVLTLADGKSSGRRVGMARLFVALGEMRTGRFDHAVSVMNEAIEAFDSDPDSSAYERASVHVNLASLLEDLRDYAGARRYLLQARDLLELDDAQSYLMGRTLLGLASAEGHLGDTVDAMLLLDRAADILRSRTQSDAVMAATRDPRLDEAEVEKLRGSILREAGFDGVVEAYRRSLDLIREVNGVDDPRNHVAENVLGGALSDAGEYEEARLLLGASLTNRELLFGDHSLEVATACNNLGILESDMGNYEAAITWLDRCLAIRRERMPATAQDLLDTVAALGGCHARAGHTVDAMAALDEAVRGDFAATTAQRHGNLANLSQMAVRRKWVPGMLATLTMTGEAAVGDAVAALVNTKGLATGLYVRDRRSATGPLRSRLTTIAMRLAALSVRGPLRLSSDDYLRQLVQMFTTLSHVESLIAEMAHQTRLPYLSVTDIARSLPPDSTLVDISLYLRSGIAGDASYSAYAASVIRPDGRVYLADLGPTEEIDDIVLDLREEINAYPSLPLIPLVERASAEHIHNLSRQLYDHIIAPIEASIEHSRHIILSLDGTLGQIPFAAMVDHDGRYMIDRWLITYLSNVYDLHERPRDSDVDGRVVLFAAPDFGEPTQPHEHTGVAPLSEQLETVWTPLDDALAESNAVIAAVGADRVVAYIGDEATKARLLALHSPDVLHLATHAFSVGPTRTAVIPAADDPNDSPTRIVSWASLRAGLVLAGANARRRLDHTAMDDGLVTSLELSTALDLSSTRLVVLSACQTAVGDRKIGESVHGLRHACHAAGAYSVIASFWSIADTSSAALIGALYRQLANGDSAAAALHAATYDALAAARATHGQHPHPYHWAAFALSGSARAVFSPIFPGETAIAKRHKNVDSPPPPPARRRTH